jgi:hypothetical protein
VAGLSTGGRASPPEESCKGPHSIVVSLVVLSAAAEREGRTSSPCSGVPSTAYRTVISSELWFWRS